jgi:hypothetical protein
MTGRRTTVGEQPNRRTPVVRADQPGRQLREENTMKTSKPNFRQEVTNEVIEMIEA